MSNYKIEYRAPPDRGKRPPCISYKEACEVAGVGTLSRLLMREDAPKPTLIKPKSRSVGRTSWYSKPVMLAWITKLKGEGLL